jgi:hypothetical protein
MVALGMPPATCESARWASAIEYVPGPHAGSDSLTWNEMASQADALSMVTLLSVLNTAYDRFAVPSKNMGPGFDAEGVGVWLCVGDPDTVWVRVWDGDCVWDGVWLGVGLQTVFWASTWNPG